MNTNNRDFQFSVTHAIERCRIDSNGFFLIFLLVKIERWKEGMERKGPRKYGKDEGDEESV